MNQKFSYLEKPEFPQDKESKLSIIESILFASGEVVDLKDLRRILGIYSDELDELLIELEDRYKRKDSGLSLSLSEETVQLTSKSSNYKYIKSLLDIHKRKSLSKAGSEVLAIIAYNQPITRIEIEQIRGVNSSGAIQKLIDQGLIKECGKKEVVGRPYLFGTTDLFLHLVGIKNLTELPSFEEFTNKDKKSG